MDTLPDNLTTEEFIKLGELHEQYEISINLVRYHKMINSDFYHFKKSLQSGPKKAPRLTHHNFAVLIIDIFFWLFLKSEFQLLSKPRLHS